MILSTEDLLSDDQAITTTADSTNVIQIPANSAPGQPLRLLIQVTEDFEDGTSVAFDLETDDNAAFSSAVNIASVAAIAAAVLVEGYEIPIEFLPKANEEFIRLEYTVVGTFTAGKITAGFVHDRQSNKSTFPTG